MTRVAPIDTAAATPTSRQLLEGIQKSLGMTPNMMRTMAHSAAVLDGYLAFNRALSRGVLTPAFREQLALAVAQQNHCDYCLSAHTAFGKSAGLSEDDLGAARSGRSGDPKQEAGLRFAQDVVSGRGQISDDALSRVRQAGYSEAEIAEVIAHIALNIFTNYFNLVAKPEIDFPPVTVGAA
jgi:uncharacterized peroxidase-related enzyme